MAMEDVGELIETAIRELGPGASDEEVALRVLDHLTELSDSEKTDVVDQMLKNASNTQLTHLREVLEARTGRETPGQGQSEPG